MISLSGRLSLGLAISLVLLLGIQLVVMEVSIRRLLEEQIATRLEHDAESLLAAVGTLRDGSLAIDPSRVGAIFKRPFSGHYFELSHPRFNVRSRSLWDQRLALSENPAPGLHEITGPLKQPLLVLVRNYVKGGEAVTIAVAEDLTRIREQTGKAAVTLGVLGLVTLLVLLLVQRLIVRVTLRPLKAVEQDVAALEQGKVERLGEDVPKEVQPLVAEFNRLLAAMSGRMERSRNALGNLAHALKTPLTLILQVAERKEMESFPEARDTLLRGGDTIHNLVERELKRARLAGAAPTGLRVDLKSAVEPLAGVLSRVYQERGIDIALEVPDRAVFPGDREDMLELFGNLLDNACKWAESRVRLRVDDKPGLCFTVEDDGPGCAEADLTRLATRGVRVDEDTPGHGLGLAIAQDVVMSYGGEISFGRSEALGGFEARVRIPEVRSG
ncbi:MAG: sensor histidine kinase [Leptospirillia bacterium]